MCMPSLHKRQDNFLEVGYPFAFLLLFNFVVRRDASHADLSNWKSSATNRRRHRRNVSAAFVIPVGFVLPCGGCSDNNPGLKKSLPVTCAPRDTGMNLNDSGIIDGSGKKKTRSRKKSIRPTCRKTEGVLMHSKAMDER
ncbi:hypothetical protein Nepgr_028672 [Nepenthes gracilis]|uniref:Uncharacterized protein n=1 Tax=Nepenthes gracilis TaxID=150966 RepID=A0AAD3TCQ0_NEPGR|nr:hypothetical protein Nepgr_028672 [Nepenthes gracilis]